MKRITASLCLLLAACNGSTGATDGDAGVHGDLIPGSRQVITAGGKGFDRAYSIAIDDKGNRYVAGYFEDVARFDALKLTATNFNDMFVARLDANAGFKWVTTASGGSGPASYNQIDVDSNGLVYVSGHFLGNATFGKMYIPSKGDDDGFVIQLDQKGKYKWLRQIGGTGTDGARGLAAHPRGGCTVVGHFSDTLVIDGHSLSARGETDIFVARLDASGRVKWANSAGGVGSEMALAVAVPPQGGAVITGSFNGTASFDQKQLTSSKTTDMFVARLDTKGKFVWAASGGGEGLCKGEAVAVDRSGNTIVAGSFYKRVTLGASKLSSRGTADLFITRLDPKGSFQWTNTVGGENLDQVGGMAVDSQGTAFLAGTFMASAYFGDTRLTSGVSSDLFLAGISSAGKVLWAQLAGGSKADGAHGVVLGKDDRPHLTGYFKGQADFGGSKVDSQGDADIFIWDF